MSRIHVSGLDDYVAKIDLEDAFDRYGRVRSVWVARNPPGFAFVEMEDVRDADDAIRGLDGARIRGCTVRCEWARDRRDGKRLQ